MIDSVAVQHGCLAGELSPTSSSIQILSAESRKKSNVKQDDVFGLFVNHITETLPVEGCRDIQPRQRQPTDRQGRPSRADRCEGPD